MSSDTQQHLHSPAEPPSPSERSVPTLPASSVAPATNLGKSKKDSRFWIIFSTLNLVLFLSALELLAVPNALPTIAQDLHSEAEYAWVGSAYALASTAFLPFSGGIAQIFGRKPALLSCIGLFFLGSGICGGASSMAMMIAGRTVQGLGGGAIQGLTAIILADLVTLEERGLYAASFGVTWSIAMFVSPIVGGALASAGQWRWLFYMNLPIAGFAALVTFVVMNLPTPPGTIAQKLKMLDWIGNLIIVASTAAVTIALTWGGVVHPWNSAQVLAPLIVGCVGFVAFILYEVKVASYPLVPWSVLSNRTSVSGYLQTFFVGINALSVVYYLPIYFQAIHNASPVHSGVLTLAFCVVAPGSMMAGSAVNKTGRYRPQMWAGWVLLLIGFGVMSTITVDTPTARVLGFLVILGFGLGFNYSTTVFPVQAPISPSLNAPALSFLQFARAFSGVWGVTIGSAVLQNQLSHRLPASFLSTFPQGVAISFSAIPSIRTLPPSEQLAVRQAFADSLQVLWEVMIGVAGIGALSSAMMKGLELHKVRDEKWAMGKDGEGEGNGEDREKNGGVKVVEEKESPALL